MLMKEGEIVLTTQQELIMQGKICPYCYRATEYVDSKVIYNGISYGMIYLCVNCRAFCGVHKDDPTRSLGRVASRELRECRKQAHAQFDLIWKQGHLEKSEAYKWLSQELEIPKQYTHMGMFSQKTCLKVIEVSKSLLLKLENGFEFAI